MAWKLDNPLYSLSEEHEQQEVLRKWGEEKLGGLMMGNARMPFPMTFLIGLIVLCAFLVTMPIWGQRPTAELFRLYVEHMNDPAVQSAATGEEKIKILYQLALADAARHEDARMVGQVERHPTTWDDLQVLAPQIIELQKQTLYTLPNYSVIGDKVVLANFEGSYREDGLRERTQPWWDKGYTIDVLYVSYFFISMVIVTKRLPHFSKSPVYK